MQELTRELDKYKGSGEVNKHISQSDPFYCDSKEVRHRYNVNGNGDIYFINSCSANNLQEFIQKSISDTRYGRQGFKKKAILDDINKNHNYSDISSIIKKHFEVV
jgi:hypothetical protein